MTENRDEVYTSIWFNETKKIYKRRNGKKGRMILSTLSKENDELANRMRQSSIKRITEKIRYDFKLGET